MWTKASSAIRIRALILLLVLVGIAQGQTPDEQLAEKFKPILVLDSRDNNQSPKEVAIVADPWSNIWFEIFTSGGQELDEISASDWVSYFSGSYDPYKSPNGLGIDINSGDYSNLNLEFTVTGQWSNLSHPYGVYLVRAHFDFGGPGVNGPATEGNNPGWEDIYDSEHNNYDDRIYAHVFDHPNGTSAVIQYWFFYPYNDWINNHEGDWEHISVIASNRDPNSAQIDTIEYHFHEEYVQRTVAQSSGSNDNPVTFAQGGPTPAGNQTALIKNRPVVYVGGWGSGSLLGIGGSGPGGHGSYPTYGSWYFSDDIYGLINAGATDNPDGQGRIVDNATLQLLKERGDYNYSTEPEMSWFNVDIPFGHISVPSPAGQKNDAPEGPAFKTAWNKTAAMAGTSEYEGWPSDFNFQHPFVIGNSVWNGEITLRGDIFVPSGASLTIEPGTTINMDHPFTNVTYIYGFGPVSGDPTVVDIFVAPGGTLIADASGGQPIVFRSVDTANPDPVDWGGILNYGNLTLKNCVIRDASIGLEPYGTQTIDDVEFINNEWGIGIQNAAGISIGNVEIHDSNTHGIYIRDAEGTIHNALIHNNGNPSGGQGISITRANYNRSTTLNNVTISNNNHSGVWVDDGIPLTVNNSIITTNTEYGIWVETGGSNNPVVKYSDIWGNGNQGIQNFGGYIGGWQNPPNGSPSNGQNVGNITNDPLYTTDYKLAKFSGGIDLGDPGLTDPDGTQINMGRYGGTSQAEASPLILNGGFEGGNDGYIPGWIVSSPWNINGTWPLQQNPPFPHPGIMDNQCVGSYPQESSTGTLSSTPFTISKNYINFRIGGQDQTGNSNDVTLVLTSNPSSPIKLSKPPADNGLIDITWDVQSYAGQQVQIIVDDRNNNGSYAWFCVDGFEQSNSTTTTPSGEVGGGGTTLLFEDFDDGQAQGWSPSSGNWVIKSVDGSNRYVMESSGQGVNRSYVNVAGWSTGYTVEARLKFNADEGKIIYSKASQNERYRVDLMANSDNFRLKIDDVSYNHYMTIDTGTWYDVKIEVTSSSVKTWLNGAAKHNEAIGGAPDGYIGVGSYEDNPGSMTDHVMADDVKVTSGGGGGGGLPSPWANLDIGSVSNAGSPGEQ